MLSPQSLHRVMPLTLSLSFSITHHLSHCNSSEMFWIKTLYAECRHFSFVMGFLCALKCRYSFVFNSVKCLNICFIFKWIFPPLILLQGKFFQVHNTQIHIPTLTTKCELYIKMCVCVTYMYSFEHLRWGFAFGQ